METQQLINTNSVLQGGGEMGAIIRNFNWAQTALGEPAQWPKSLHISLANMLNSGFPMFLFWGSELTCFYNDAFRPSLGINGKHPAIGKKGVEVWSEIWHLIGPLIDGVLQTGKPVWSENQLVPFYRNGRIEDIYWTFSYSLLTDDDGLPAGVLVTCMETTDAVLSRKKLEQSQDRLHFALHAGHMGSWQLDLKTFELKASSICKQIFGRQPDELFTYEILRSAVHPDDQQRQEAAVMHSVSTGADYDIEYRVIWPDGSLHWVNIRGQLRYDDHYQPTVMVGVSLDITDRKVAEAALQQSEERFRNIIEQTPVAIALTRGDDLVFESINAPMLRLIGKSTEQDVLGKPLAEVLPEVVSQPIFQRINEVLRTGKNYHGTEVEALLQTDGVLQRRYFNINYSRVVNALGGASLLHMAMDVTEQVLTRRNKDESEAKLRTMLNSAPTAIGVFVGPDLIVENPNQVLLDVLGVDADLEGKSFRKILSGLVEDGEKFINLIDSVRASGKPFEAPEVKVFFKRHGQSRYFNINFIPLFNDNNEVYAVLDICVDVTAQVVNRMKVEESEGRFRLLADASPNFIWMLKPDGTYGYVNKTTLEYLGVTQEEMAERGWGPYQHPDDLPAVQAAVSDAVANLKPYQFEHRLRRHDGEYRWVLSQAIPAYDGNGAVFAYVGSSIDINEAKKDREKLQTALEQIRLAQDAAELGTFDIDVKAGTAHWDKRCRDLFGIRHQNPVTYEKDFVQGLHPDDRERIIKVVERAYNRVESDGDFDVVYRTIGADDGVERWIKAKGKVYFNAEQNPVRFIGSMLDVTDQMTAMQRIEHTVEERTQELARANESLQSINKELQRSNANLEEFAYAASHDLKEPIRKIHVFTNQLKDQLSKHLNDNEVRLFSRIENATQRMGNLVDDLLLYSHVSQRPHETEQVNLSEKVQRVLEDLEVDIEEKKAVVQVGELPVVQGYRRQIQQLLQNLLSNALKYSKTDEASKINIAARQEERGGRLYHVISVTDNGIGFEQQYREKIFQMFARLHGKAEYSGTGVGLSIVKKVVENHDGLIEVYSELGVGSTFEIYLPA